MRLLKIIATLVGGLLAAVVLVYLALLFVNRHDQPPSKDALRFAQLYRDRPSVANADNGYPYAMDFFTSEKPERTPAVQRLADACRVVDHACIVALDGADPVVEEWFAKERGLFDRYQTLLAHSGWYRTKPFVLTDRLPAYGLILQGQRLLLLRAWALAGGGDVARARGLLAQDARFWRMVLESSDLLIDKMIAVAALNRHFGLGNLVLRRLPADRAMEAMPREWTQGISAAERSMTRTLAGEWEYFNGSLRKTKAGEPLIYRPLFQPQDTSNRLAAMLAQAAHGLDAPYDQYPQVLQRMQTESDHAAVPLSLYNPIATMMTNAPDAYNYGRYGAQVADVEGARRAAVLATTLRSRGVAAADVPAQLSASEIRVPYTNGPFAWDLRENAIVFTGLEAGERGRHDFKY
jgi:hypothetical protein